MGQKGIAAPVHEVELPSFWLAETPVTNDQYAKFVLETGYKEPLFWRLRRFSGPDQPVVGVNWDDAMAFCSWASERTRAVAAGVEVTLPREAQWEYAARATDGRRYPWGNESPNATRARFGRKDGTARVGMYMAGKGPFGHLDLAGNVWEWCLDRWVATAYARAERLAVEHTRESRTGDSRVLRGGSWCDSASQLLAEGRFQSESWHRSDRFGFRVAAVGLHPIIGDGVTLPDVAPIRANTSPPASTSSLPPLSVLTAMPANPTSSTAPALETWDAFISYAHDDANWVRILAENLHRLGLDVFFDEWEVDAGAVVSARLDEGLRNSRSGMLVVSKSSVSRPWVLEEYSALLKRSVEQGQRLIPILIEEAEMPPMLATRRWIDFRGLRHQRYGAAVRELAAALRGKRPKRPPRGGGLKSP